MELAPNEKTAGLKLLNIYLDDKKADDAEGVLNIIKPHLDTPTIIQWRDRLAILRRDVKAAEELWAKLCVVPDASKEQINNTVEAIRIAGWSKMAERTMDRAITSPDANPNVVTVRIEQWCKRGAWGKCSRQLRQVYDRPALWAAGAKPYMAAIAGRHDRLRLRWFVYRHRERLQQDEFALGAVGHALTLAPSNASGNPLAFIVA